MIVQSDRAQAFCVFMSVSLCNYSHSSAHSSDSCRFCQVDIQELAINNSARFVWPARSSARRWGGHLNLTRGETVVVGGGCRQLKAGKALSESGRPFAPFGKE